MDSKKVMKVDMGPKGTRTINVDYPSNSITSRTTPEAACKKVTKVTTGKVFKQKKSASGNFLKSFINEDVSSIGTYILYDVLIPTIKTMLTDVVQGGLERLLFGDSRPQSQNRRPNTHVSYNKSSLNGRVVQSASGSSRDAMASRVERQKQSSYEDLILTTRKEAEEVLYQLVYLCREYGQASIGDLYDLVGITGNFTDNRHGWYDLGSANIKPVRGGYMLNLPRTTVLD